VRDAINVCALARSARALLVGQKSREDVERRDTTTPCTSRRSARAASGLWSEGFEQSVLFPRVGSVRAQALGHKRLTDFYRQTS
jgi:hypothetical protein